MNFLEVGLSGLTRGSHRVWWVVPWHGCDRLGVRHPTHWGGVVVETVESYPVCRRGSLDRGGEEGRGVGDRGQGGCWGQLAVCDAPARWGRLSVESPPQTRSARLSGSPVPGMSVGRRVAVM